MRKLIIVIVLVLLLYGAYEAVYEGSGILNSTGYRTLIDQNKELNILISTLNTKNTTEFAAKKQALTDAVKQYEDKKLEYETLAAEQKQMAYDSTDLYDIDFLWTKIGNYATDNSVILQFDVIKSVTATTESNEYTVCDLEFTAIGDYIGVTDFIYDIEDDDRFKFEICEFTMIKPDLDQIAELYPKDTPKEILEEKVKATFKVKNLPVNASSISSVNEVVQEATEEITETVTNANTGSN